MNFAFFEISDYKNIHHRRIFWYLVKFDENNDFAILSKSYNASEYSMMIEYSDDSEISKG